MHTVRAVYYSGTLCPAWRLASTVSIDSVHAPCLPRTVCLSLLQLYDFLEKKKSQAAAVLHVEDRRAVDKGKRQQGDGDAREVRVVLHAVGIC